MIHLVCFMYTSFILCLQCVQYSQIKVLSTQINDDFIISIVLAEMTHETCRRQICGFIVYIALGLYTYSISL